MLPIIPENPRPRPGSTIPGSVNVYPARRRIIKMAEFLSATYESADTYKSATDLAGRPMLIPHEGEASQTRAATVAATITGISGTTELPNRYARRLALAAIENHYAPIADRVLSYLTSSKPLRPWRPSEYERVGMDDAIARMVADALRYGEAWIGADSRTIIPSFGDTPTRADAREQDPEHRGRPYIISALPTDVVAADFNPMTGAVSRVVIRYISVGGGTITTPANESVEYREWTDRWWAVYREESEVVGEGPSAARRAAVRCVDSGDHAFGHCPWQVFRPNYPLYTIAELQRVLFNINSLHDEELYQATFTQRYIIGAGSNPGTGEPPIKPGPGNVMFIPNVEAKVGVFGADPQQARSISDRAEQVRRSIYAVASMDMVGFKAAAESEGKKQLDMEPFQRLLGRIVEQIETIDNRLAVTLGIIEDPESLTQMTQYERDLDVLSVSDYLDLCERVARVPYSPPSLKRSLVRQLAAKVEPLAPDAVYRVETDRQFDFSAMTVGPLMDLHREGALTPEMFIAATGLPAEFHSGLVARISEHETDEDIAGLASRFGPGTPDSLPPDGADGNTPVPPPRKPPVPED